MLVGGVVVRDDYQRHVLGHTPVHLLEEREPFHVGVAPVVGMDDDSRRVVEGG